MRGVVVGDRILQAADTHPDCCAAFGQLGGYRFVGASAIGQMHVRESKPRDDAFAIRTAGPWVAAAVADGVGSYPASRYGSCFAVEALCEQLLRGAMERTSAGEMSGVTDAASQNGHDSANNRITDPVSNGDEDGRFLPSMLADGGSKVCMTRGCGTLSWNLRPFREDTGSGIIEDHDIATAFRRARQGMEHYSASRGVSLNEMACTLLGILVNTETGHTAAGQIGDGIIARFDGTQAGPLVEARVPGPVGETYSFTSEEWESYLSVRVLKPQESSGTASLFLMTDGVSEDCIHPPPEDVFTRWARDMDRETRREEDPSLTAARLLHWLTTYERRGSWDDRTLLVLLREGSNG